MKHIQFNLIFLMMLTLSLFLITNCKRVNPQDMRYEIHGYVNYGGEVRKAIWYTDTIELGDNYATYTNSDGSEVVIPAPFVLIDHKYDSLTKNTKPAFR